MTRETRGPVRHPDPGLFAGLWRGIGPLGLRRAVAVGFAAGEQGTVFGEPWVNVFDFVGRLFLNGLKMIIVPLIAASMIVGVAGVGRSGALKRLGGRTLLYYAATSLAAIVVGLTVINIVKPGIIAGEPARDILALETRTADVAAIVGDPAGHA